MSILAYPLLGKEVVVMVKRNEKYNFTVREESDRSLIAKSFSNTSQIR